MARMTAAQAAVEILKAEGVTRVFGLPGAAINGYGVDRVKVAEGLGCKAIRVTAPDDILPALERAKKLADTYRVPVIVEVILERITNVSMGNDIDAVNEFEELAASAADAPTAVYATRALAGDGDGR